MMAIRLTQEQADAVRGEYSCRHILMPIQIGEYWYLPVSVLDNPMYEPAFEILNQCEIVEYPVTEGGDE